MRNIAFGALAFAAVTWAMGTKHDFPYAVMVFRQHPDLPIESYFAGELGLPEPDHARIYLYGAYRYLNGTTPLSTVEQRAIKAIWKHRRNTWDGPDDAAQSTTYWNGLRAKVPVPFTAPPAPVAIETRSWVWFSSPCNPDTDKSATNALRERIAKYGIQSREVRFWTQSQDAVLLSCNRYTPPPPLPSGMPAAIKADHEYQTAAALFHGQRLNEAQSLFQKISSDKMSPWRIWAPYMVGRTLLWQARTNRDDRSYRSLLLQAEAQFLRVLSNPGLRTTHEAAELLLIRCMSVTNPRRAAERLAFRLTRTCRYADLLAYLNVLDNLPEKPKLADLPQDQLSQWILLMQNQQPHASGLATRAWKQIASAPWLLAALMKCWDANEGLIEAGLRYALDAPGGVAIRFHTARLLAITGRFDDARTQADAVLAKLSRLPSARNRALDLKQQLAPDLQNFMALAPKQVMMSSSEHASAEFIASDVPEDRALVRLPRLDSVAETILNRRIPLDTLAAFALKDTSLPVHLRDELRLAALTRAILLSRSDLAQQIAPLLVGRISKSIDPHLTRFAVTPSDWNAVRWLVRTPGARPYLLRGYGRLLAPHKLHEWGGSWWDALTEEKMHQGFPPYEAAVSPRLLPALPALADAEVQQAQLEFDTLRKIAVSGRAWMAQKAFVAVRRNPRIEDGAEVLYKIVEGCSSMNMWVAHLFDDPKTAEAAIRMLRTYYPMTKWRKLAEERLDPYGIKPRK